MASTATSAPLRAAMEENVLQGARFGSLGLSVVFLGIAVLKPLFAQTPMLPLLFAIDSSIGLSMLVAYAGIRSGVVRARHVHGVMVGLASMITGKAFFELVALDSVLLSATFILLVMGTPFFLKLRRYYYPMYALEMGAWMVAATASPASHVPDVAFYMFIAAVAAPTFFHVSRSEFMRSWESQRRFQMLAEHVTDVVYLARLGPQAGLDYISPSIESLSGYTPAEFYADPGLASRIVLPEDLARLLEERNQMGLIGGPYVVRLRSRDGRIKWSEQRESPVLDRDGRVVAVLGVARDVTAHVEAENALRESNERLEAALRQVRDANQELEAFSYSTSHDLRAPLRGLEAYAQALLEDHGEELGPSGRETLARLRREAGRLSLLVNDLLRLSRVGRDEVRREDVDLAAIARSIAGRLRETDPARRCTFVIPSVLMAHGDRALLGVALDNLLNNAWKYTARTPEARIEVGAWSPDGTAVYYVRDNGAGFDPSRADRLFRPFQRLHAASEFEGTGIGLATVQRIVHRHGGRTWAEGSPGKGATFYFTLAPVSGRPTEIPVDVGATASSDQLSLPATSSVPADRAGGLGATREGKAEGAPDARAAR